MRLSILRQISVFVLMMSLIVSPFSIIPLSIHKDFLSPPTQLYSDDWMEDVFLVISDITDTLIDRDNPPDPELATVLNQLLDRGVIFAPLTGRGRGNIQKTFFDYLGAFNHPDQILLALQNGGIIMDFKTSEKIAAVSFPPEIHQLLRDRISFHMKDLLSEFAESVYEWDFQPPGQKALKSILFISFLEKNSPPQKLMEKFLRKLEEKLESDSHFSTYLTPEGRFPWALGISGRHIILSTLNKVEVIETIVEQARKRSTLKGKTVVIIGNTGGEHGNDAQMLSLKKISGFNLRTIYVGTKNRDWAKENGIYHLPDKTGPEASISILKEIERKINSSQKEEWVQRVKWVKVEKEHKELIKKIFIKTDLFEKTVRKFFKLNIADFHSIRIKKGGAGNENIVFKISLYKDEESDEELIFSLVVSHRRVQTIKGISRSVTDYFYQTELQILREMSGNAGLLKKIRYPLFGYEEDGVYTRTWLEGEEAGEVVGRIKNEKALRKLLIECSSSIIDFWIASKYNWIPMVHDDDVIVNVEDEDFEAALPDLNTPIRRVSPLGIFMEIFYFNYELVQIYNQEKYQRHAMLNSEHIRMLVEVVLKSFYTSFESINPGEGKKVISRLYGNFSPKWIEDLAVQNGFHHFTHYAFRILIEDFMIKNKIALPGLPYGRPIEPAKLTVENTTPVLIDELREMVPRKYRTLMRSPVITRPFDDPGYKENAVKYERMTEILLSFLSPDATPEKIKRIFEIDSQFNSFFEDALISEELSLEYKQEKLMNSFYLYRILNNFIRQGVENLEFQHRLELLYGLLKDFNMPASIPCDWVHLYRCAQGRFYIKRDLDTKEDEVALTDYVSTRILDEGNRVIRLTINDSLGRAAGLWHAVDKLENVYAMDVYVNYEFGGVIDLSFKNNSIYLEKFRLNNRSQRVGTAIVKWLKTFAQRKGISYIRTFEFTHFLHLHLLNKYISSPEVLVEDEWVKITKEEAQMMAIDKPTKYRFRFKVPSPESEQLQTELDPNRDTKFAIAV